MNYYERHIGDYVRDTAHLTMLEHGAYTLLMDRYYATEAGIPADQAHRLARARTREEKAAVDAVLQEFFALVDGVWTKRRIEQEIEKAQAKINAAKENGRKGGRPKRVKKTDEVETQQKPSGLSVGSENETQQKAHQAPDTRHHLKPSTQQAASTTQPETAQQPYAAASPTRQGMVCRLLREAGVFEAAPHHLDAATWDALLAKRTDEEIVEFARAKLESRPGQRTSLRYLAPGLLEDPRPVEPAGHRPAARTPRAENFHTKDYGQGGAL